MRMKYFCYRRKSTEEKDRQILSIESQMDEIEKRFPGIDVIELPPESKSAFKPYNRPIFSEMMERIQNGEAQGIVCYDPSRLARNPLDAAMVIHLLDTGVIKDLKFCTFHFDNSPEGKMMLQFALSQSKYSSDKLSKDVKRGMVKKCKNGWRPNVAPIGYINDPHGLKGERKILPDPDRFDLTRKMWDMLLSGRYRVSEIWKIAHDEWKFVPIRGKGIVLSTVYKIFTNPFYYGEFEWDGERYEGQHEAMITKEEFDKAQLILGRKGKPRPQKHRFAFTGMMKCGTCGCSVTAEHKIKKLKKTSELKIYRYYRCTRKSTSMKCKEPSVSREEVEDQISQILETITVPKHLTEVTLKYLRKMNKKENKDRGNVQSSLQKAYNGCTKRIENLLAMFISPANADKSLLTDDEYKGQKVTLMNEKKDIEEKIRACESRVNEQLELNEKTFEFAAYAKHNFDNGTLEDKRVIFQNLGQNFLLKDGKVGLDLHKQFMIIKDGVEKTKSFKDRFSLTLSQLEDQSTAFAQLWCRGAELNHRRKDFQSFALPLSYPGT